VSEFVVINGHKPGDKFLRRTRHPLHRLRRVLGVPALFSSAYGNVGSSIYYALGVTAAYALGLTPLVFMFSGLLFAMTALSYAEGTAAIPEAGGSSSFARRGFNELVSFIAGWALLLDYIVTIAFSAFEVPNYLAVFFPILKTWPANSIGGMAVIAFLIAINVIGVKEATGINIFLALLDLLTQVLLILVGMFVLFNLHTLITNVRPGIAPTWEQLIYGISISMVAYTGIETVSNMAEEARTPEKTVPRSITLVLVAVLGIYFFISVIALSAMPVVQTEKGFVTELATLWETDPVMGIVHHFPEMLRVVLGAWVGLLAATILFIATNAGVLGVSRLTYSMGQHCQIPAALSTVHKTFRTPYRSIVVFGSVAMLLILPGQVVFLADLYSFGAMLAFTFAHLSVIALRIREPHLPRPFKAPLNVRLRGYDIPLTAVIGGMGTLTVWLVVIYSHDWGRLIGTIWLIAGLGMYVTYRQRRHLPLTTPFKLSERTGKPVPILTAGHELAHHGRGGA